MRLRFRPQARRELLDAKAWYEERATGLGLEFSLAVDAAVQNVAQRPLPFPLVEESVRRALVKRFPYTVFYTYSADEVLVVGVFHHRREPLSWRLPKPL